MIIDMTKFKLEQCTLSWIDHVKTVMSSTGCSAMLALALAPAVSAIGCGGAPASEVQATAPLAQAQAQKEGLSPPPEEIVDNAGRKFKRSRTVPKVAAPRGAS